PVFPLLEARGKTNGSRPFAITAVGADRTVGAILALIGAPAGGLAGGVPVLLGIFKLHPAALRAAVAVGFRLAPEVIATVGSRFAMMARIGYHRVYILLVEYLKIS